MSRASVRWMTANERKTYDALLDNRRLALGPTRALDPVYRPGLAIALTGFIPIIAGAAVIAYPASGADLLPFWLGVAAALGIQVLAIVVNVKRLRRWREEQGALAKAKADSYAASLRLHSRDDPAERSGDVSVRQAQHLWYDGHSELDWHDRVRAEMYGMDAHTYVSNFLERD